MKHWSEEQITCFIQGEKLTLQGFNDLDPEIILKGQQLIESIILDRQLFVIAYKKSNTKWEPIGPMSYAAYFDMMKVSARNFACHPVNYRTLAEFDKVATTQ